MNRTKHLPDKNVAVIIRPQLLSIFSMQLVVSLLDQILTSATAILLSLVQTLNTETNA